MTESIVDFNNDKEFPIATMFYCLKITGLLIVSFLMSNKYLYINILDKTATRYSLLEVFFHHYSEDKSYSSTTLGPGKGDTIYVNIWSAICSVSLCSGSLF